MCILFLKFIFTNFLLSEWKKAFATETLLSSPGTLVKNAHPLLLNLHYHSFACCKWSFSIPPHNYLREELRWNLRLVVNWRLDVGWGNLRKFSQNWYLHPNHTHNFHNEFFASLSPFVDKILFANHAFLCTLYFLYFFWLMNAEREREREREKVNEVKEKQ